MKFFRVLILAFSLHLYPALAQSEEKSVPDFSTNTLSEYGLAVPHVGLKAVAQWYDNQKLSSSPKNDQFLKFFKAFSMTYSPQYIRANQKYFRENAANIIFLNDLKNAKDWFVKIIWSSPEKILETVEQISDKRLNFMLNYRAFEVESDHEAYKYFLENSPKELNPLEQEASLLFVFDQAQLNYRPAMIDLAEAYRVGEKLPKSLFKSYFWYLNAKWEGADVDKQLSKLSSELSGYKISEALELFEDGLYPNLIEEHEKKNPLLDLSYRRIPPYLDEK